MLEHPNHRDSNDSNLTDVKQQKPVEVVNQNTQKPIEVVTTRIHMKPINDIQKPLTVIPQKSQINDNSVLEPLP